MASLLILDSAGSSKSEDFTTEFDIPFNFKRIALQSFSMWVSWNNIDKDNNQFSYFDGSKWTLVTIPDGNYTSRELNNYLANYFGVEDPPVKFGINFARQRFVLKLAEHYKVDFKPSRLFDVLGFEPRIYDKPEEEARFIANISKGVDSIHIHCDVIEGAHLGRYSSEILYSFTPQNPPGSLISKEIREPLYFKVKKDNIQRIRMRVTDQHGHLIDLNGQQVLYRLLVKTEEEDYLQKIYQLLNKHVSQQSPRAA